MAAYFQGMEFVIEIVLRHIFGENKMIGMLTIGAIAAAWLWVRWRNNTPPEKIDRKLLRFIGKSFKINQRVNTSSIYAGFINESTPILDRSLGRLKDSRYIDATIEYRGNPITCVIPYYEIHGITEKGYRALRIARFLL